MMSGLALKSEKKSRSLDDGLANGDGYPCDNVQGYGAGVAVRTVYLATVVEVVHRGVDSTLQVTTTTIK